MKSLAYGELKSIPTLGKLSKSESQSRNPSTGKGRRGGHERAAISPLPLPVSDSCLRRIFRWRVPPNWSVFDWRNEMRAEAACAAWQAVCDYDPSLGVPFSAFAHQRVLTGTLTRCRQEWAYALRLAPEYDPESSDSRQLDSAASAAFDACPGHTLACLSKSDRWLVGQLFLRDRTETDIAAQIGITQQAISKRKRAIVKQLRRYIDRA
jgi:DNA-directed RNA polymerase specialized sigma24 family protein